jgi:hypothetical protein
LSLKHYALHASAGRTFPVNRDLNPQGRSVQSRRTEKSQEHQLEWLENPLGRRHI